MLVICQEFIHPLRFTKARRGPDVIKVDLERAYGRLEWRFVKEALEEVRLPSQLRNVIMQNISRGPCRLL